MLCFMDFMFLNFAFATLFLGTLVLKLEKYLPKSISKMFRYGKFGLEGDNIVDLVPTIPKSCFRHFYIFSVIWSTLNLFYLLQFVSYQTNPPSWLLGLLDLCCGTNRIPYYNPVQAIVGLSLLTLQCYRRCYETLFVQVFSKTAKINLTQYFIGIFHYFGCVSVIMAGFFTNAKNTHELMSTTNAAIISIPVIFIFLYAWKTQYESNVILANLRKDSSGKKVISQKYHIPVGGLFKYVSSPHNLTEILLYCSLTLLLNNYISWIFILVWVVANQVETALFSHAWYKKTFDNYPKERKAVIPHIL